MRSSILDTVIFCTANDLQPAYRRLAHHGTESDAGAGEGVVTRARGCTQINNIFEYSLKEARGFSQRDLSCAAKNRIRYGLTNVMKLSDGRATHGDPAGSDVFTQTHSRYVDEDAVSIEESRVPAHI